ncbi:AraC family transcriptional regulator [Kribbella solani]|uniref:AraC family transcriptional regulator n=1 Tax=Kribbella solani TaxID=236067 RepID=UPI0029B80B44|nr:AraC family transcriptional regulator [Kribbella solani]MDX2971930.1 AraC family transcriptional regulator [Kribbella solani]
MRERAGGSGHGRPSRGSAQFGDEARQRAAGARPLEQFELFHTGDLDDARDTVGRVFVPHRLDLAGKAGHLDARMHTRRFPKVAANYVSYGAEVLIDPEDLGSFFVVQVPLTGFSHVRSGREAVLSTPQLASVVSPTEPLSMRWSADCTKLILRLERSAVEDELTDILEAPLPEPLRFALGMDVTKNPARSWLSMFRLFVDEIDDADEDLLVVSGYEDVLIRGLLYAQPHNYTHRLGDTSRSKVPSRAIAIARDIIENHPEWDHTVTSLAREAGVSPRALQKGFARYLGVGPKEYMTAVRMQRAHSELRSKHRDTITVRQVAGRWHLGHTGRFATEYRKRFGELPSETLAK